MDLLTPPSLLAAIPTHGQQQELHQHPAVGASLGAFAGAIENVLATECPNDIRPDRSEMILALNVWGNQGADGRSLLSSTSLPLLAADSTPRECLSHYTEYVTAALRVV